MRLRLAVDSAWVGPTDIKRALVRRVLAVAKEPEQHWRRTLNPVEVCLLGATGGCHPLASTRNSVYSDQSKKRREGVDWIHMILVRVYKGKNVNT
jgi:hypothetical protein